MSNIRSLRRAIWGLIMAIRHLKRGSVPPSQQHERNSDVPSVIRRRYVIVDGRRRLVQIAAPRISPPRQTKTLRLPEYDEDSSLLSLFLDLAWKDIQSNPSALEPYTEEMSAEDDELLAGVVVD